MAVKKTTQRITISPPNFKYIKLTVKGTSPFMQSRFGEKVKQAMMAKHAAGSTATKGKKREPRNFDEDFEQAIHYSEEGWIGHPASAFRNACIDVCRMVGHKMTHAKMSIFCEADGLDNVDGQPLVKLIAKKPERTDMAVRNATGVADIRTRPMWREWSFNVTLKFDADQFTENDVANLIARAGAQCGIGEGRHFSKSSNGLGYGCFEVV